MNAFKIKVFSGQNSYDNTRNFFLQIISKQKILVVIAVCYLLFSIINTSHACKKQHRSKVHSKSVERKIKTRTAQKATVVKNIEIKGHEGKLYLNWHLAEVNVGDVAAAPNMIEFCKSIAAEVFKKYPDYSKCKITWEVVAHNDTVSIYFLFQNTNKGIKRIK